MPRVAGKATTWIALLRAVNVGGHASVGMADLRGVLSALRLTDPRSLLQTGNLVFAGTGHTSGALEILLENEAASRLSLHTDFFVRSAVEWQALVDANPFRQEAARDPAHLVVMCLKRAPSADDIEALRSAISGPEVVQAIGKQLYAVYPAGIGRSKLTMAVIERTLRTRGTGRNWNTVLKLKALACAG
jgi:uncharacterized protein (DUF1697 family)